MKQSELIIKITEYSSISELPQHKQKLVEDAIEATESAYAPYSEFKVGAAVMLDNGEIIKGSNQENAAYPSGLCAERVALFYANATYPNSKVKSIAVCAKNNISFLENPVPPCGSCRQVIAETSKRFSSDIEIILYGSNKIQIIEDANQLLPLLFNNDNLT